MSTAGVQRDGELILTLVLGRRQAPAEGRAFGVGYRVDTGLQLGQVQAVLLQIGG
jgi:hypothetical protein